MNGLLAESSPAASTAPALGSDPLGKVSVAKGTPNSQAATTSPNVTTTTSGQMQEIVVVGQLDHQREEIVPSLGATVYTIDQQEIQDFSQGNNIPFDKLVLRFPGVSQDSEGSGSFHVRDEHANVQYRINDVLIPESITSFGSQFDTRFADHVDLITGALPAQYGFRESGVLDIHTKSGAFDQGGEAEMYGGSQGTVRPSFEYGGTQGKLNYYFSGNYLQDDLGIENPTASTNAIHDNTDQYRGFAYLSYIIDNTSRLSLIAGEAYNQFEIPNSPDQQPAVDGSGTPFAVPGAPTFDSTHLNETQREQNNFEVLAYQKSMDDFDFQVSLFDAYSAVVFEPDPLGDLFFNGVSGRLNRSVMSNGVQFDSSYRVTDSHTVRAGLLLNAQGASQLADTTVIPEDATGAQDGLPEAFHNRDYSTAYSYGFYLQDEWKLTKQLTLNFGGRFDLYQSSQIRQNQLSPRVNGVYTLDKSTSFHAGYANYFTPPPLENIPRGSAGEFAGTSNAPSVDAAGNPLPNNPVKSERANYFDLGTTRNFTPEYQVGFDAYYKTSTNTLDDGQFGAAPILSAFNYARGQIFGLEFSQSYTTKAGFSAYGNIAVEQGIGTRVNSAQAVLFSEDDYRYISNHYIYLDHSQTFTGSAGFTYNIAQTETRPYLELVTGSGLRTDTDTVPNGGSVPAYDSINIGFTQGFRWVGVPNLTARFDVTNVGDQSYVLRDGAGVGVFAPQYGARRAFYGGLSYSF